VSSGAIFTGSGEANIQRSAHVEAGSRFSQKPVSSTRTENSGTISTSGTASVRTAFLLALIFTVLTRQLGFIRYGNRRHPSGLACIMSNGGPSQKRMFVGQQHAGEQWTDILEWHSGTVTIDSRGYGIFPVSKVSVSVWVNARAEGRESLKSHLYVSPLHQSIFLETYSRSGLQ
jgi:hypothetical protein